MAKQAEHGISWTEETWNPIRGCSRVSEGCRHCYAERVAHRFSGAGQPYEGLVRIANGHPQWTGAVRVVDEHMLDPLKWKRPRRIFVNSMSDLFHENVADETIDRIFAVMALCPQHTFQVLTKRPERMRKYLGDSAGARLDMGQRVLLIMQQMVKDGVVPADRKALIWYPLRNVWLGVSVENQAAADERIPLLLQTPAAVRWISAEPLLGGINLRSSLGGTQWTGGQRGHDGRDRRGIHHHDDRCEPKLDWVVVGGESGPGARPMEEAWARSLRDQCVAAGVAFHFKQWGAWLPAMCDGAPGDFQHLNASDRPIRVGKRAAGRTLDGRTWDEYPGVRA